MVQNLIYNLCESFIKNIDGIASITKNTPPQEEILAPATFEVTLNYADGYYWATFYTSMANYQAPDGVRVYKVNLNGSQFTSINVEDGIINKRQGVVLRSSTSSITLTKTYSKSSDDYSNNSLIGTDYQITNPGNAYGLNYKQSHGLSFYPLSSTGKIKANAAYLIMVFTYLTQWKIVGNSEVHDNEIWSCGEYNATDGKYHILVQPLGGSIADIALTEPLRKVNDVADTIEFPSDTEGKALVTRSLKSVDMGTIEWFMYNSNRTQSDGIYCIYGSLTNSKQVSQNDNSRGQNILTPRYTSVPFNNTYNISPSNNKSISYGYSSTYNKVIRIQDSDYNQLDSTTAFKTAVRGVELIYELETPTTELVDAPQIKEADSYSMVISQGGKAVEWSSFET